jgi:predicted DNA-binding transcriptional regulator AlpA
VLPVAVTLWNDDRGDGDEEQLLTAAEVAGILRVRVKRVYELGIPAVRISHRSLRWRRSTVDRWLADREER